MNQYSETLMGHFQDPHNRGHMESPSCVGIAGIPGQGRYIQLFLNIAADRVERMQFDSYGCGVTIAVCSILTELAEGRTRSECADLCEEDIISALDGIPPHKRDCAHFGIVALQNALEAWNQLETNARPASSAADGISHSASTCKDCPS